MKLRVVLFVSLVCVSALQSISILVEVSIGELVDKITILEIKASRITDEIKLQNITNELETLVTALAVITPHEILDELKTKLKKVNEKLWDIEDDIRMKELKKEFDDGFIKLARAVYFTNDERAHLKKEINLITKSRLVEEKSYQEYIPS